MTGLTVVEHTLPGQHIREYFHATISGEDEELLLHLKQYIPNDNQAQNKPRRGITLIAAHSNAYSKVKPRTQPTGLRLTGQRKHMSLFGKTSWLACKELAYSSIVSGWQM